MRNTGRNFKWFSYLLLLTLSTTAYSQNQSPEESDSSKVKTPYVISSIDIVGEIEEEQERLKIIERETQLKSGIQEIDSLYRNQKSFIDDELKKVKVFLSSNPNKQKVSNITREWKGYGQQVDVWQGHVNSFLEDLTTDLTTLNYREETWNLTLENAMEEQLPDPVLKIIREARSSVLASKESIQKKYDHFLALEAQLNALKSKISEIVEKFEDFKRSEVYNIFHRRHPPIWYTQFGVKSDTETGEDAERLSANLRSVRDYFSKSDSLIDLFILSTLLSFLLILYLRRSFSKYEFNEESGELQRAKDVIVNRTWASLLFVFILNSLYFFSSMPAMLNDLLMLAAIIAAIPLVIPYLYKRFKAIVFVIPPFYVLDHIKTYIWFSSTNYRIYLLMEAVIVMVVIYRFVHPYLETRRMKIGYFGNALIKSAPVLFFLAIVSMVSNLLGFTNLTDITLKICTESAVLTIIFYAVLNLSAGMITGILHAYFNNKDFFEPSQKLRIELKAMQLVRYIVVLIWLIYFLEMIDQLDPVLDWFTAWLKNERVIGSTVFTYGAVLLFLGVLALAFIITSVISLIIDAGVLNILKLPKGVPAAVSLVIRYFIIAFGFIIALSALGINLSQFNLMAGALGLGIGFGLQNIVSNFISGLILVFERPILTGDTVEVNNLLGTVHRIGVRSSNIRTFDGAEVVVPNNNLISNDLINWTLSDNIKRIEIAVGTAYGSDPNKVLEILVAEARKCKNLMDEPKPRALFVEFGESSLNFLLHFWVPYHLGLESKSEVMIGIYNALKESGVEIPFPQRDLYIKELPSNKEDGGP